MINKYNKKYINL